MKPATLGILLGMLLSAGGLKAQECIACHTKITPNIVQDWRLSKHSANDVECSTCHGDGHTTADDVASLSKEAFDVEWEKMLQTCNQCHSINFARAELEKDDDLIEAGDALLAQAIRVIVELYRDGILEKPNNYTYDFPDLLTFSDAPTPIEHTLFNMHLKHRMRLFQGAFHANPDYALWYGWSEMVQDVTEINTMAEELRNGSRKGWWPFK